MFALNAGLWGTLMTEASRFIDTEARLLDRDVGQVRLGAGFLAVYAPLESGADHICEIVRPFAPLSMNWYLPAGVRSLI